MCLQGVGSLCVAPIAVADEDRGDLGQERLQRGELRVVLSYGTSNSIV